MPTARTGYHPPAGPDRFAAIDRPTLVVDRGRAERNIARMAGKAAASGVRFRPHFEAHNAVEVGAWFRDAGVTAITVSSVEHAVLFADAGWDDVTIAFPLVTRALPTIRDLGERIRLGGLLDSPEAVDALEPIDARVDVWIDIDCGYGRSGAPWDDAARLAEVGSAVVRLPRARLPGRADARRGDVSDGRGRPRDARRSGVRPPPVPSAARDALKATTGMDGLEVSVGDTPGCSVMQRFDGVDEVRPGNFVFYDLQQLALGSCAEDDLALAVACPIVGVYPARGEAVVHGGSVQLSRDVAPGPGPGANFGRLVVVEPDGWRLLPAEDAFVRSISQEHGVLRCSPAVLAGLRVGDLGFIVPAHACMPANLVRQRLVV